jgi:phytoene dehydrogenase-like protein
MAHSRPWAYCHVPHGTSEDVTNCIEEKIERYAPGFNELILAKNKMTASDMELYNPNDVGGTSTAAFRICLSLIRGP